MSEAIQRPEFSHLEGRVRELELWRARVGGIVLLASIVGSMVGPLVIGWLTGKK